VIQLKSKSEIELMRASNQIVAKTIAKLAEMVEPGISTYDLDALAEENILAHGGKPAFKGYRGFPATLCISINDEVVHGIPSKNRILQEGDIVSIDCGVLKNGFFGDSATTVPVGKCSAQALKLIEVAKESLTAGIEKARDGNRVGDISHAVQKRVEKDGFSVVKDFVGHGIGRSLHEEPQVPNFGEPGNGPRLRVGMVLALEPMINTGSYEIKVLEDGWTAVTLDNGLSAHVEHSIAITERGPEILSLLHEEV
jgi:methionyl aminopeptidase